MTAGEEAARSALAESVERNRADVQLAHETVEVVRGVLRQEMRDAVAEGIAMAMTDENAERFWVKGFEVAQQQAKKRLRDGAGDLVLGGLRGLFKWGSMVVIALAFAYYVGGWSLVKTVWAAFNKG
jgi:hypothetical protein